MPIRTFFTGVNSIAFRDVAYTRPDRYNRGHLDDSFQKELLLRWQDGIYAHPIQRLDRFRLMFDATDNASVSLRVFDCNLNPVHSYGSPTADDDIAGNLAQNSDQFHTYQYKLADLSAITDDGTYYFVLDIDGDWYFSHPFHLRDTHEDTVLIEYTNTTNTQRTYFEQLPTRYAKRVHGYITDMQAVSSDTVFEDQSYSLEQLDSIPYRVWTFYIGHTDSGIPDYELDNLNRIFSLDTIYLDGKQYLKQDGATWKKEGRGALYGVSIEIREADEGEGFTHGESEIELYTTPSYPFAVKSILLGKNLPTLNIMGNTAYEIADGAAETAFIADLNSFLSNYELGGTVVKVSGVVYYQRAAGEDINISDVLIYTSYFEFTHLAPNMSPYVVDFVAGDASMVIKWADNQVTRHTVAAMSTSTISHSYAAMASGTKTVRIWGDIYHFEMEYVGFTGFVGTLPPMGTLIVKFGTFPSNTFNFNLLATAAPYIQRLELFQCSLTALSNFTSYSFPNLKIIEVSGNSLGQTAYNSFIANVYSNVSANNVLSGVYSSVGQTTGAFLNAGGATTQYNLETIYSWTVNA